MIFEYTVLVKAPIISKNMPLQRTEVDEEIDKN